MKRACDTEIYLARICVYTSLRPSLYARIALAINPISIMEDVEKQTPASVSSANDDLHLDTGQKEWISADLGTHQTLVPTSDGEKPRASDLIDPNAPGEVQVSNIRKGNGMLRRLRAAETWFDRRLNFEAMGVERVPENKRQPPQSLNVRLLFPTLSLTFESLKSSSRPRISQLSSFPS